MHKGPDFPTVLTTLVISVRSRQWPSCGARGSDSPWLLTMLRGFSYACWPFAYLLWGKVYWSALPAFHLLNSLWCSVRPKSPLLPAALPRHAQRQHRGEAAHRDQCVSRDDRSAHTRWFSQSVWPDYGTWISLNGSGTDTYIMLQEIKGCGPQSQAQNGIYIFKWLN